MSTKDTVPAAPSDEAKALAAKLSGLKTNVAVLAALIGVK